MIMTLVLYITHHKQYVVAKMTRNKLMQVQKDSPGVLGHIFVFFDPEDQQLMIEQISIQNLHDLVYDEKNELRKNLNGEILNFHNRFMDLRNNDTKITQDIFYDILSELNEYLVINDYLLCIDSNLGFRADPIISETAIRFVDQLSPKYLTFFSNTPQSLQQACDWIHAHDWLDEQSFQIIFEADKHAQDSTYMRSKFPNRLLLSHSVPYIFISQDPKLSIGSHMNLMALEKSSSKPADLNEFTSSESNSISSDGSLKDDLTVTPKHQMQNKSKAPLNVYGLETTELISNEINSVSSKRYPSPEIRADYDQFCDIFDESYKYLGSNTIFSGSSKSIENSGSSKTNGSSGSSKSLKTKNDDFPQEISGSKKNKGCRGVAKAAMARI